MSSKIGGQLSRELLISMEHLIGYSGTHFDQRFHDGGLYVQDKIEYPKRGDQYGRSFRLLCGGRRTT